MKVFVFNGPKVGYGLFGTFCLLVILYVGFAPQIDTVIASADVTETTYIALVIDGFGSGIEGTREFLYMDIPYTAIVEPSMSHTSEEIRLLSKGQRDVLLDIRDPSSGIKTILEVDVNNLQGININGKSKLMQDEELAMQLLTFAKEDNLILFNSDAKNKSISQDMIKELSLDFFQKDIVIDETSDISKIEKNLKKAADIANKKGYVIALGNLGGQGGKYTAQAIKNIINEFEEKNVKFVTLTELLELYNS